MRRIKKIKISELNTDGAIRTPLLPKGFITRVQKFKNILAEVEKMTLEETILNFQRDLHPERELEIWEHIARIYKGYEKSNPNLTLLEKRDVLSVLLGLSMGMTDFDRIKRLSGKQIVNISNNYLGI
jgi:hypothetical protein